MKAGDIIVTSQRFNNRYYRRRALVLPVTNADIKQGANAAKPGLYAFAGCWYGQTATMASFGKVLPAIGTKVGTTRIGSRMPKRLRVALR